METLHFKVADACFAIHSNDSKELKKLLPSYAPFFIRENDEALIFEASVEDGVIDTNAEGDELGQFDCGGTNHGVYKLPNGYKIVISNIDGHFASAMKTNDDFSQCTISLFGNDSERKFGLGNALMIAFAFAGAYHRIILMHSSVTINDEKCYMFLGKSGTGKSTHSQLWHKFIPGSDLLNDDNPAVRVHENGDVIVYGTPWSGKTPCYRNLKYPVGAIVRLEQWPENIIRQYSKLEAFASVLSACSTMIWDKPSYNEITKTVEKVAQKTAVFYLKCRPDEEAALLSYHTITKK